MRQLQRLKGPNKGSRMALKLLSNRFQNSKITRWVMPPEALISLRSFVHSFVWIPFCVPSGWQYSLSWWYVLLLTSLHHSFIHSFRIWPAEERLMKFTVSFESKMVFPVLQSSVVSHRGNRRLGLARSMHLSYRHLWGEPETKICTQSMTSMAYIK